jgi:hypothetical protein
MDRNTLAGIARAHQRAQEVGIRLVVGCRIVLRDKLSVLVYPTNRAAYAGLCRLLIVGKGRAGKGECDLCWEDRASHGEGLIAILLPDAPDVALEHTLALLKRGFAGRGYLVWPCAGGQPTPCGCESSPIYPDEADDPALTPQQTLEKSVWTNVPRRYPDGLLKDVDRQLRHELRLSLFWRRLIPSVPTSWL